MPVRLFNALICLASTLTSSAVAVPNNCFDNSPKNGRRARSLLDFLTFVKGINWCTILTVLFIRKAVLVLIAFN